jgi:hypothetical protein
MDIEQPFQNFGWFPGSDGSSYQAANRDTYDGFTDWWELAESKDSSCPGTSSYILQPEVYTSQAAWYGMFSAGGNGNGSDGVITDTPVWTTQMNTQDSQCSAYISSQPSKFSPSASCTTDFYGASNYEYAWQWEQDPPYSGDYDLMYEPYTEPVLSETFGY